MAVPFSQLLLQMRRGGGRTFFDCSAADGPGGCSELSDLNTAAAGHHVQPMAGGLVGARGPARPA
jgi:hypothetical protein